MPNARVPWAVAYDGPGARSLAVTMSIASDLRFAAEAFARVATETDTLAQAALWNAAAVAYRRAFSSGGDELLARLRDDDRAEHAHTLDAARELVAAVDQPDIVLMLANPEFEAKAIIGVMRVHPKPAAGAVDRATLMAAIAAPLAAWAAEESTRLRTVVLAEAEESGDLDELYKNARPLG